MKSLKDISLPITEEEYRNDGAMHYSTLATYERGGFHSIPTLGERKESSSLVFGSVVDCLMTGSEEEFEASYLVSDLDINPSDLLVNVTKGLFNLYSEQYHKLEDIPESIVIAALDNVNYGGKSWYAATKRNKLLEAGAEYYKLMYLAKDKTIISSNVYKDALSCVNALRTVEATKTLFAPDNPFNKNVERCYQLKFSQNINGVQYSCMADLIYVIHDKKLIIPCDLKTSSHYEDEFYKSFIDWNYDIQARLYANLIKMTLEKDDYFKDFKLANYHFIVVNKKSLKPLVWEFEDTFSMDTLYFGKDKQIERRHPFVIGEELNSYLKRNAPVQDGILLNKPNSLREWLNKI